MIEDGVYLSSVPSFLSGLSSSKWLVPDPILEVEVAFCSIGIILGVVQVVQNWFITGTPNPTRSSRLRRGSKFFIGRVRMVSII